MEFNKHTEYYILDSLIDNNIHFALYRLPKTNTISLIMQKSGTTHTFSDLTELNGQKGFAIVPYHITGSSPIVLIKPDIVINEEDQIFSLLKELNLPSKERNTDRYRIQDNDDSSSFERYRKIYDLFQEELESGKCTKLVLSRTFDTERGDRFSAGASFAKACKKYPDSFVFLYHTPVSGTWLGCSPERLISGQNNQWITDALAGTQKADSANHVWDDKNKLEQQIVVDYMQQQLSKAGINSIHSNAETIQAGNLLHLRSEFSFQLNNPEKIGNILDLLHPSPAINGFPKEEAFDFILDNEGYNRTYYSGFIGNLDTDLRTDLFVNLRCMQISENKLRMYAGGGILPSSDLFSEWKETENKLQTIISIIENI